MGSPTARTVPLVGRDALVDSALEALRSGARGVLLTGPAGIGKSAVAHAVAARLRRPLVELSPLAGDLAARLADLPADAVLHLDDADSSAEDPTPLLRAVLGGKAVLVATARRLAAVPAPLAALVDDGALLALPVPPLGAEGMRELLAHGRPSPVAASLVMALLRQSGGSPRVALALLADAPPDGGQPVERDAWLRDPDLRPGVALTALAETLTARQDAPRLAALEAVALTEPVSADRLAGLADPVALDALAAEGILARPPHPANGEVALFALASPAVGIALRARLPVSRAAEVHAAVLAGLRADAEGWRLVGAIRSVSWSLANGAPVPVAQGLAAARLANRMHDYPLAARLATGLLERTDDPVERARAHVERSFAARFSGHRDAALDDAVEAHDLVAPRVGPDDPLQTRALDALLDARAAHADLLHYELANPDAALALLRETERALGWSPAVRERLRAERVIHLCYAGRFAESVDEHRGGPFRSPALRVRAGAAAGLALANLGTPQAAAALLTRGYLERRVRVHSANWLDEELHGGLFAALFYSVGVRATQRRVGEAPVGPADEYVRYDAGLATLAQASMHLAAGRAGAAVDAAESALRAFADADPSGFERHARALAAEAAALAGDAAAARRHVAAAEALPLRSAGALEPDTRRALLRATIGALPRAEAVARIRSEAADLAVQGIDGGALRILALGVLLGDRPSAERAIALASHVDGRLNRLVLRHARALLADDVPALLDVCARWERLGHLPYAVDTAAQAALVARAQGLSSGAAEADLRRAALRALVPEARGLLLPEERPAPPAGELTAREREIAALLARGASNRDIATALSLSVRTVEGHLARIYRKLGMSRREELAGR